VEKAFWEMDSLPQPPQSLPAAQENRRIASKSF
jgi:hypothetical protein